MINRQSLFIGLAALVIIIASLFIWRAVPTGDMWEKRIDAAVRTAPCKSVTPPNFGSLTYAGTLIDTHIHIPNIPDGPLGSFARANDHDRPVLGGNITMGDYVCAFTQEKTAKVFAFFPVYEELPEEMVEVVKRTVQDYPGTFVPFIMPPANDDSPDGSPTVDAEALEEMLGYHPDLFKGYGEIGLYAREGGAAELPPDAERLQKMYPVVRHNKLLVYFHLGEGHADNFEKVLAQNRDINFIWHGDQLIKGSGTEQDLSVIEGILNRHPNVYYGVDELYGDTWLLRPEVSKEEFLAHFADYERLLEQDVATWKGFIERYPNQVLWGTDRGWSAPWSLDEDVGLTLAGYARAFIARLDPASQEKFAYQNAERLLQSR